MHWCHPSHAMRYSDEWIERQCSDMKLKIPHIRHLLERVEDVQVQISEVGQDQDGSMAKQMIIERPTPNHTCNHPQCASASRINWSDIVIV